MTLRRELKARLERLPGPEPPSDLTERVISSAARTPAPVPPDENVPDGGRIGFAVSFQPVDTHRRATALSAAGLLAGGLLAVVGVPSVDLHGPLHYSGIMDPLCGGTRAAYLFARGSWGAAWTYNPGVFPLTAAATTMLARAAVGMLSGRWLTVHSTRRRMVVLILIALVALAIRQQLHAGQLTADWTNAQDTLRVG